MNSDLKRIFQENGHDNRLTTEVARLARRKGEQIYREALLLLTGKDFSPGRAASLWRSALDHERKLFPGAPEGEHLRAALLDYLHRHEQEFTDPRLIEARHLDELQTASLTDGLTGLYNQTCFKTRLEDLIRFKGRNPQERFAIAFLDLDHFKQYNDRCGHLAGDDALRQVAEIIRKNVRDYDVAARYGGEEFALILFRVGHQQAFTVAERIRSTIAQTDFPGQEKLDSGNLTISGGLALFPGDGQDMRTMLEAADRELYAAKRERNRIVPTSRDRRRSSRKPVRSFIEVSNGDGDALPGLAVDLSEEGLSVNCAVAFAPGTTLCVRFRRPFWDREHQAEATVRRIRHDHSSGIVHLGLEFSGSLAGLNALVSKETRAEKLRAMT